MKKLRIKAFGGKALSPHIIPYKKHRLYVCIFWLLNPQNVLCYFNRAVIKMETGDLQGAFIDLSQAIEIYPDFAKAYQARSSARNLIGDRIGAMKDQETAKKKIDEYMAKNPGDTTLTEFMDTAYNFKKIIALSFTFNCDGNNYNRIYVI